MVRIVAGPVTEEHVGVIAPMYKRLRGDRANVSRNLGFTFKTKVDPKSKQAIQRFAQDFASEDPAAKQISFSHIFHPDTMPAQHVQLLHNMGMTPQSLVNVLSHPDNSKWLAQVLTHDKAIASIKIAGDRFHWLTGHSKNVSAVWLYAMQGRKGLAKWRSTSARDDISSGIIAAVADELSKRNLPPTEIPQPPGAHEEGERQPPQPTQPLQPTPPQPAVDVRQHLVDTRGPRETDIKIFDLVKDGIKHHKPSQALLISRAMPVDHEVSDLIHAAHGYVGHLWKNGMVESDVDDFATHAVRSLDIHDFHARMNKFMQNESKAKANADVLEDHVLPAGAVLHDKTGRVVFDASKDIDNISAANWKKLHYKVGETKVELTEAQRQGVAAFLASRLMNLSDLKKGHANLSTFAIHVNDRLNEGISAVKGLTGRRRLSDEEMHHALEALLRHGHDPAGPTA